MIKQKFGISAISTHYGNVSLFLQSAVSEVTANVELLLTPDVAERLADEIGKAIEEARKTRIERAS